MHAFTPPARVYICCLMSAFTRIHMCARDP